MELSLGPKHRRCRRVVAIALVIAGIGSGIAAVAKFDLERFRSDADRLKALAVVELPTAGTDSADWPQWRGPNRDGTSSETGLLAEWPAGGPPILWKKPIGRGFSSFSIAKGRLITMDQESSSESAGDAASCFECIVCLDATTGQELWRFRYANRYDERFGPGPRSTPTIDGDFVFAVGPTGMMHCLRVDTGELVWRCNLTERFQAPAMQYGIAFSPLVEGERVFVMPGGANGHSIAALDKRTGALLWRSLDHPASYSSPILTQAGGLPQIIFLTNTHLVSVAPESGQVYWRRPWKAEGGFNIATPLTFGNYLFVASGYGKGCALFQISVGPDGLPSDSPVYEHNRMRPYFSSPVRIGEHFYGFDQMDLVCMNVRTGVVAWREKTIREFHKGTLLAVDGRLIVVGENGTLSLVEATPAGFREKSKCRFSSTRCWAAPALANGRLYVRDDAQIVCFDLRP